MQTNTEMKKSKYAEKVILMLVFGVVSIYLFMQFSNVMVYFDDYGYYSLTYGVLYPHKGNEFTIRQLLDFLYLHYLNCNGRIVWFFIWLLLYYIGGLRLVQISAALITIGVLTLLWKFTKESNNTLLSAVLVCAFFGAFSIDIQRHGTYWLCPFFLYVAPIVPLVLFLLIYFRKRKTGYSFITDIIMVGLIFFATFSQEQLAVAVFSMTCMLLLYEKLEKNSRPFNWCIASVAFVSMATLMLSPGIQQRASMHEKPVYEMVLNGTASVIRMFFSEDLKIFVFVLFLSILTFSIELLRKDDKRKAIFDRICIWVSLFSMLVYCWRKLRDILNALLINEYLLIGVGGVVICLICVQSTRYYIRKQQISRLIIFYTSVISVACLCVVPELPYRLMLPSWLLLFPMLVDGILLGAALLGYKNVKYQRVYLIGTCCIIGVISVSNSMSIYHGYAQNAEVHKYNDAVFGEAAEKENKGEKVEVLYLKKIPESLYAGAMVYDKGMQFMKEWMRNYYGLSSDPILYYSNEGTAESQKEEKYVFIDQGIYMEIDKLIITNISYRHVGDNLIQIGVECSAIYQDSIIEINDIAYPTIVGSTFVSTELNANELSEDGMNIVKVVVPRLNLQSEEALLKISEGK